MLSKIRKILYVIAFCMIAVLLFEFLTVLCTPKWLENRWAPSKTAKTFYDIERNTLDMLTIGSSVSAAAVDPFQLYEKYGISSYNMSLMTQPMMGSYYWLIEMLKYQKPKVVALEIKTACRKSNKDEKKARKSFDYMRWGRNKYYYAKSTLRLYPEAKPEEYYFPMSKYHNRWSQLNDDDYAFAFGDYKAPARGFCFLTKKCEKTNPEYADYSGIKMDPDKKSSYTYNKTNLNYLKKIVALCNKKNIKLILFKVPDTTWNTAKYNYMNNFAKQNKGVDYIDYNTEEMFDIMDFNYATDAEDTVHINMKGAKKITDYLGKYVLKKVSIKDARKDKKISNIFKKEMDLYNKARIEAEKNFGSTE